MLLQSLTFFITTAAALAVRAATNPVASKLWTLVGCDDTDFDTLVTTAAAMAQAAVSSINNILDDTVIGHDNGSPEWYDARNAMILWGIEPTDLPENKIKFEGDAVDILNKVKLKYQTILFTLIDGDGYWKPEWNWIFCKPFQQPHPFAKVTYLKDLVNNLPPEYDNELISNHGFKPQLIYPSAGFVTQATNQVHVGMRRVSVPGTVTDICDQSNRDGDNRKTIAFVHLQPDQTSAWMAFCSGFYTNPATVGPSIPDDAVNLDSFESQAGSLLHELMHLRFPDIIDVKAQLSDMSEPGFFYGMEGCGGLAGIYFGGNSYLAMQNADNYSLFARASYLQPRKWKV